MAGCAGCAGRCRLRIEARATKMKRLVVPEVNAREAAMVGGVEVYPRQIADRRHSLHQFGQWNVAAQG